MMQIGLKKKTVYIYIKKKKEKRFHAKHAPDGSWSQDPRATPKTGWAGLRQEQEQEEERVRVRRVYFLGVATPKSAAGDPPSALP